MRGEYIQLQEREKERERFSGGEGEEEFAREKGAERKKH